MGSTRHIEARVGFGDGRGSPARALILFTNTQLPSLPTLLPHGRHYKHVNPQYLYSSNMLIADVLVLKYAAHVTPNTSMFEEYRY
jgi:hypothetical protein